MFRRKTKLNVSATATFHIFAVICFWKSLSHGGWLEIQFMKIYSAKMAKYQKDAAGIIKLLNSRAKKAFRKYKLYAKWNAFFYLFNKRSAENSSESSNVRRGQFY